MTVNTYDGGRTYSGTVAVNTAVSTTEAIPAKGMCKGSIYVPTGSSITGLTVHASHDGTTYYAVQEQSFQIQASDDGGVYLSLPVIMEVTADEMVQIRDAVFPCVALKLVGNAAGNIVVLLQQ